MPDYSDEEAREARRIVDRLLDPDQEAPQIEGRLVVSDIESDAAEFAAELELLKEIGVDAPAVGVGEEELVPVALSLIAGPGWPVSPLVGGIRSRGWRRYPFFHEWAYFYFRSFFDESERFPAFATISHEQARSTFLRRASNFLATRLAAVHDFERQRSHNRWSSPSFLNILQRAGGPRVSTPGCHFTVPTNSSGLRVFWSGAYRVSPNYFSHPTTPTLGVLQSGTYVFGVDGAAYGNQIQWDLNAVVTLPGSPHAHLNY